MQASTAVFGAISSDNAPHQCVRWMCSFSCIQRDPTTFSTCTSRNLNTLPMEWNYMKKMYRRHWVQPQRPQKHQRKKKITKTWKAEAWKAVKNVYGKLHSCHCFFFVVTKRGPAVTKPTVRTTKNTSWGAASSLGGLNQSWIRGQRLVSVVNIERNYNEYGSKCL